MSSPTSRTLHWLREQGYMSQVVERWSAPARKRIDLFGCIDIVAVRGPYTVGVQATSASGISARLEKIRTGEAAGRAKLWLAGGQRQLWVVGWKQYKKPEDGKWWRPILRIVIYEEIVYVESDEVGLRP